MNLAKRFLFGSLTRVSYTLSSMIIAFIMMPIMVTNLGDRWYGIWIIVAAFTGVYHVFDLGMTSAVSRYISKSIGTEDYHETNVVINTGLVIFSGLALLVLFVTIGIAYLAPMFVENPEDISLIRQLILITGASVALEFPFHAFAGIPEARMRFDLLTYNRLFTLILGASLNYYVLTHGYGVLMLVTISFGIARLGDILYYILAKSLFQEMTLSRKFVNILKMKEFMKFSIWSFSISVTDNLAFRANPMIIAYLLSASSVTHYVVGQRLVDYANKFLYQATNMLTPLFTQYYARGDYEEIRKKYVLMIRFNSILGLLAIGGLIMFSSQFITRWLGSEYLDGYSVVVVRIFGAIGGFIFSPSTNVLFAINQHHILAKVTAVQSATMVVLAFSLVGSFGIVGAALAATFPTLISHCIVIPMFTCNKIELSYRQVTREITPILLIGSLFLFIAWMVLMQFSVQADYLEIVLASIVFAGLYLGLMFFSVMTKQEKELIYRALPRFRVTD